MSPQPLFGVRGQWGYVREGRSLLRNLQLVKLNKCMPLKLEKRLGLRLSVGIDIMDTRIRATVRVDEHLHCHQSQGMDPLSRIAMRYLT